MTDKEKAEEYLKDNHCNDCMFWDCCYGAENKECVEKTKYIKNLIDGLAEGRKEKCLEQNNDGTIRPCEVMKENEELKAKLNGALDICNIPEFRINDLEKENEQLKAQIEKMKCCGNCKHNDRPLVYDKEDNCYRKLYCKDCYLRNKWELKE